MSKRQNKDPMHTLLRFGIILLVVVAVCLGAVYGIDSLRQHLLSQKVADVQASNDLKQQQYNAAVKELENETAQGESAVWPTPQGTGWEVLDLSDFQVENTTLKSVDRGTLLSSGLLLVNQWHALPADFEAYTSSLVTKIAGATNWAIGVASSSTSLFPNAVDALLKLVTDAKAQGLEYYCLDTAMRSMADQQALWDTEINRLSGSYSGNILNAQAMKNVNYPGTSEYQSGVSFHIQLYSSENKEVNSLAFSSSPQGVWFNENAWKYGFVFRFPVTDYPTAGGSDKSYITGVSAKRNVYRYVGEAHAAAMRTLDMCLEEYIEYLMDHPHIAVYENGTLKYEICRMTASDAATVACPVTRSAKSYQADLDNMGGIVLAYTY